MTPARAQRLLSGQPPLAQRIYRAIPSNEFWTVAQIRAALIRSGCSTGAIKQNHMEACLHKLLDAGLTVRDGDTFRACVKPDPKPRVKNSYLQALEHVPMITPIPESAIQAAPDTTAPVATTSTGASTMQAATNRIAEISTEVIDLVDNVRQTLTKLTRLGKELEDVAITITQEQDRVAGQMKALEQVQALMRSLNLGQ